MRDYNQFSFWDDSHKLAVEIYNLTKSFPKSELYGVTNQLRRASLSLPTNIAEGCGRDSVQELTRFMVIANGSNTEVQYLLFFCFEVKLLNGELFQQLNNKTLSIKKRLATYISKL